MPDRPDPLAEGFGSPPHCAKPLVWWHWVNGEVGTEGIRRDLEWFKRIGIGGLQNFDGAIDGRRAKRTRLVYMTREWKEAFRFATVLCDELGLEFGIASSPGWSETGGPWVEPRNAMKKLVWSVSRIIGGGRFRGSLPAPPSLTGPFQDLRVEPRDGQGGFENLRFYRDVRVIAYRTPPALIEDPKPVNVTVSDLGSESPRVVSDVCAELSLQCSDTAPGSVLFDFGQPKRFRAASLGARAASAFLCSLESSSDGFSFDKIADFPRGHLVRRTTITFSPLHARFLRVVIRLAATSEPFHRGANAPGAIVSQPKRGNEQVSVDDIAFYSGARIHRFEDKAGFQVASEYYTIDSGVTLPQEAVNPNDVLDVTESVDSNGEIDWDTPAGHWTILRLGYSLTGKTNHPACPEATGLEVDKLDREAVKEYLDAYLRNFEHTVGVEWMGKRGIRTFVTDSIESGGQNWTRGLIAAFEARRGYDPLPWFPALTGVTVGDSARSDRFLWDYRKTLMELIHEAHYGQIAASVHERKLRLYAESLEGYPMMAMGDDLDMRQYADVPMAAIWASFDPRIRDGLLCHVADMLGAASAAHVFGKQLVAVEALTSTHEPWAYSPAMLRPIIDLAFALGMNVPVIHTSVHQPDEERPGVTLGPFGQHFSRHETWAELATPWITYLTRCGFLLQQGTHVADVAWFYGEEGSLAALYAQDEPVDLPCGYGFDFVNANMLLNHLRVEKRRLVSSGGVSYRLLYLGGSSERMTWGVLRRLKEFSDHGVAIVGRRPLGSPSLADEARVEEYESLVAELWDGGKIRVESHPNSGMSMLGIAPDFAYESAHGRSDSRVLFIHRTLSAGDVYFLTNRKQRSEKIEARFRLTGRRPELWRADSGVREPLKWRTEGGFTIAVLEFRGMESFFVVFRGTTTTRFEDLRQVTEVNLVDIDGEWRLRFESAPGAPEGTISTTLMSWTESTRPDVRYFSGIGTYSKTFFLDGEVLKERGRLVLDLGGVHELAEVILNDQKIGIVWNCPYELEVTAALRAGMNSLVVRVANLWVNRLIGDKQPGIAPVARATTTTYSADAPLRPSGLIGPVVLKRRLGGGIARA